MTTLRERLIKIGAKVVRHGRYITFQLAEVAVPRNLFRKNPAARIDVAVLGQATWRRVMSRAPAPASWVFETRLRRIDFFMVNGELTTAFGCSWRDSNCL